jgi:hypothetical protein
MGDAQLAAQLRDLRPLVGIEGDGGADAASPARWILSVTEEGRAVLAGRLDALDARPVDRWRGGAHLQGARTWRWDETRMRLVPPDA